ncbi:APC amino acid permease [Rhodocollybia butyracea]|uniref:APC amino acid permease n=1 Tax=Rhodocollybia butyracea TaxID=206335 RepID=A0A9P5PEF6_9AGAR|nr:APC amino acid permease [Rhodocollybia butyracea]
MTETKTSEDDRELITLGYVPSFKREFSNLATISFAFSVIGLCSSIAMTFNTPLLTGGPSSVVWCWILGACMCFTLGASVAEIVSAYPTSGGLYTASAQLTPKKYRTRVGWGVGWLNMLGQIAGVASSEFGLSEMIWAAVVIGKDGNFEVTQAKTVWLFVVLLVVHGTLNCLATRWLARLSSGYMFVNLGATFLIVIVLLAMTPRSEMHAANYVFGAQGFDNQTGGWNNGLAFVFGLFSVQWTMTDYDATAHICEEVKRAAYAAPTAIFVAVIGTGLIGWLLNIVLILCSGPLTDLPGATGLAFLQIMYLRMGKAGALILWVPVCLTAFFLVQTALQAVSRTFYAFSRDHGFPDGGYFGYNSKLTQTPLRAIILCTVLSIIPGLLDLASPIASNAIFALCAISLDLSYIIPIFLRRVFQNHPEVMFKPGPFYMGDGIIGLGANWICISWTLFVCVILSFPTILPVTPQTMNYASVITVGVMVAAFAWYIIDGHRHYHGPQSNIRKLKEKSELEKEDEERTSQTEV